MSQVGIRRSQVVSTFGPGALVDLPDHAVLVAGLDHWKGEGRTVPEHRLVANLKRRLRRPQLELRMPPVPEREDQPDIGVVAWQFPEWFVAMLEVSSKEFGRSRPLVHRRAVYRNRFDIQDPTGKRKMPARGWPVVPIRFVQACPNGHISDIDWPRLVHGDGVTCGGQLWLDERGTTGDMAELFVRCDGCECKPVSLVLLQATSEERAILGECQGHRPWLGAEAQEKCVGTEGKPHRNKLLIRHASNAYFPMIERAISLPDRDERLRKAVDCIWDAYLRNAQAVDQVALMQTMFPVIREALAGFSAAEVWADCLRRGGLAPEEAKSLKDVELETFLAVPDELGEDKPEGDFYARRLPLDPHRTGPLALIESVVLVHRLREVVAEIGFTRFESPAIPVDSELDLGVRLAALSKEAPWLPAVENRGEGIFLALNPGAVRQWSQRPAVKERAAAFLPGLQSTFKTAIGIDTVERIHLPYVMLHSLSHLLLTAVALECGYAAASIRERIYVRDGAYGLLLYTGTPDAEGTLGGLVQQGRKLAKHLDAALEMGRLCSNDPVCAQHKPNQAHEDRRLHGAACHGCLLIAEPSCERRNELLDRALVVPTVDLADAAFFGDAP